MSFVVEFTNRHVALCLLCICLLTYSNSFDNSFHYDDDHSIVDNPHIRSLTNIPSFFVDPGTFSIVPDAKMYRPLLLVTYAINYAIEETQVFGYHLVNFILHTVNVWFVWVLGQALLQDRRRALVASLLFAIHPVVSEPVNYISSRSSLLATLFFLFSLQQVTSMSVWRPRARRHVSSVVLTTAALLSKSIAIALPVVAGLFLLVSRRLYRIWGVIVSMCVVSVVYVVGTHKMIAKAMVVEPVRSLIQQWATQLKAMPFYVATMVMPVSLSVEPQFAVGDNLGEPVVVVALLFVAMLVWCAVRGIRYLRVVVFSAAFIALTLLPSSIVPLNVLVNEHRLYLPMVGAAFFVAALWPLKMVHSRLFGILLILVMVALTFQRNEVWQDEETLWLDAVAKGPLMSRPYVNLGKTYLVQGRYDESIMASRKGLELNPRTGRAHYNIGTAYLKKDQYELAIASYDRALTLEPNLMEGYTNLGNAFKKLGRNQDALESYRKALSLLVHPAIYHNLGGVFLALVKNDSAATYFEKALKKGSSERAHYLGLVKAHRAEEKISSAIHVLNKALSIWPQDHDFLLMLGDAWAAFGSEVEAIAAYQSAKLNEAGIYLRLAEAARQRAQWEVARSHYERGLKVVSDDIRFHNGLGMVLHAVGESSAALESFRKAARLDSNSAKAFANIGLVFVKHGRNSEAVAALQRALRLSPDDTFSWGLLGAAYRNEGRTDKAIGAYRRAIDLAPEKTDNYYFLAMIFQKLGQLGRAEALFREVLVRDPEAHHVHSNLALCLLDQNRYQDAIGHLELALQLHPGDAGGYINLASAYLNSGRAEAAVVAYERAVELLEKGDPLRDRALAQLSLLREQRVSTVD